MNSFQTLSLKKREEASLNNTGEVNGERKSKHKKKKSQENEKGNGLQISHPTLISRTTSRTMSPTMSSKRNVPPPPHPHVDFYASSGGVTATTATASAEEIALSKVASRRCSTPIFFSQSAARVKPQPIEKKIECTLEELCLGCVKKIKITRDAISNSGYDRYFWLFLQNFIK